MACYAVVCGLVHAKPRTNSKPTGRGKHAFVVSSTNAATSSTVQARGSAGLSVASMSEPESSRRDASESDEAARRLRDLSGELSSESDAALRDLRFGEELESESESLLLRDLRFGDGDGEPWRPVSTSRAAVSRTAFATWPVSASSKASPAVAGSVVARGAFAFAWPALTRNLRGHRTVIYRTMTG
jgi:hypothetical protein